jgi:hypothetical protein
MSESFVRCSNCGELYENTMEGLNNHWYGDNPYARYHREITSNRIEASKLYSGSWVERLVSSFRKTKITNSALSELLNYKSKLNARLLQEDTGKIDMDGKLIK